MALALVVVPVHSRDQYVHVTYSQRLRDVLDGLEDPWHFFGGDPRRVVLDNLKPAVTKADRYDPIFQRTCEEYARFRGFVVDATRSTDPQDKPHLERGVPYVTPSCVASCRTDVPRSLNALATISCSLVSSTHSLRVGESNPEGTRCSGSRQSLMRENLDVPRAPRWGCLLHPFPPAPPWMRRPPRKRGTRRSRRRSPTGTRAPALPGEHRGVPHQDLTAQDVRHLTARMGVRGELTTWMVRDYAFLPDTHRFAHSGDSRTQGFAIQARNGQKLRELKLGPRVRWMRSRQRSAPGQDIGRVELSSMRFVPLPLEDETVRPDRGFQARGRAQEASV